MVEGALKLHGYGSHSERFTVTGPAVRLGPQTDARTLHGLHELGTNAAKYGALSVATGRDRDSLDNDPKCLAGACFVFNGERVGGPLVLPPTRRGFGSKLIERALKRGAGWRGQPHPSSPRELVCTVLANLPPVARKCNERGVAEF